MGQFELGIVVPIQQYGPERVTTHWPGIREFALRAEEIGFDTIWTPDELLWFSEARPPQGSWDGVSVAGAVAAVTSTAKVGTWVMSALHRNPGIIAKTAETLDEHQRRSVRLRARRRARVAGPGPSVRPARGQDLRAVRGGARDHRPARCARGSANFEGTFHAARDLPQAPRGPRPGSMPLLIGGNGPKGQRAGRPIRRHLQLLHRGARRRR